MAPCNPVVHLSFEARYCLYLQGLRVNEEGTGNNLLYFASCLAYYSTLKIKGVHVPAKRY
jgi:hypothetical protein